MNEPNPPNPTPLPCHIDVNKRITQFQECNDACVVVMRIHPSNGDREDELVAKTGVSGLKIKEFIGRYFIAIPMREFGRIEQIINAVLQLVDVVIWNGMYVRYNAGEKFSWTDMEWKCLARIEKESDSWKQDEQYDLYFRNLLPEELGREEYWESEKGKEFAKLNGWRFH